MHHPQGRAERRFNAEVWRDRQRFKMSQTWHRSSDKTAEEYWQTNRMWWARKQSSAHGNRCMCHYAKRTEVTKRRRALDRQVIENLESWQGYE